MKFNSRHELSLDHSFQGELFYYVPLSWKSHLSAIKIRVASWRPKEDRSNQAIFYYDVNSKEEAIDILKKYDGFDFIKMQNMFNEMYDSDLMRGKTTWENIKWRTKKAIPEIRNKFTKIL